MIDRHSVVFWLVVLMVVLFQTAKAQDLPSQTLEIFDDVVITPAGSSNTDFGTTTHTVVYGSVTLTGFTTDDFEIDRSAVSAALDTLIYADDLLIINNPGIISLDGLESVTPGRGLWIEDNPSLLSLTGLSTTLALSTGFDTLAIRDNVAMTTAQMGAWTVSAGNKVLDVEISGNTALTTLDLDFATILHSLTIEDNPAVTALPSDLQCVRSSASVRGNTSLNGCDIQTFFDTLTSNTATCGEPRPILHHDVGNGQSGPACTSSTSCSGQLTVDSAGMHLNGNLLSANEIPVCTLFNGSVTITGDAHRIWELGGINAITGSLNITNSTLTNMAELSSLTTIDGLLLIADNPHLSHLQGLNNVASVGNVWIHDNAALESLSDMQNLYIVTGIDVENNPVLTRLGLPYLTTIYNVRVTNNAMLPVCEVEILRHQVDLDPSVFVTHGNSPIGHCFDRSRRRLVCWHNGGQSCSAQPTPDLGWSEVDAEVFDNVRRLDIEPTMGVGLFPIGEWLQGTSMYAHAQAHEHGVRYVVRRTDPYHLYGPTDTSWKNDVTRSRYSSTSGTYNIVSHTGTHGQLTSATVALGGTAVATGTAPGSVVDGSMWLEFGDELLGQTFSISAWCAHEDPDLIEDEHISITLAPNTVRMFDPSDPTVDLRVAGAPTSGMHETGVADDIWLDYGRDGTPVFGFEEEVVQGKKKDRGG